MTTRAPYSLDLKAAAKHVGLSKDTLSKAIHAGDLKAKKSSRTTGGKTLVSVAALEDWFEGLIDA